MLPLAMEEYYLVLFFTFKACRSYGILPEVCHVTARIGQDSPLLNSSDNDLKQKLVGVIVKQ